ncbi:hypothetical protein [Tenacibaculum aquimarinum]|uniref:hypothetical protein n=1 Tax=Tenacibaculum aquimarinum TaxID=2910675 RepID=UPI001F0B1F7A|nr:hypothetical protein [Tenacibaculum aquimarinum]MCH3884776.1 hypothetical protein [Tenacibaculum aquimarinum]
MKKIFLLLSIFIFFTAFQAKEKEVFICTTTSSKTYHIKKECSGLIKCKSIIKKITQKKAENVGRIKCKLEK